MKLLGKKAQIAAFIIIGVLILAAVLYFLSFRQPAAETTPQTGISEYGAVQEFTQKCVESASRRAVKEAGYEGGYYQNYTLSVYDKISKYDFIVPLYFLNSTVFVPSKETVERELGERFNDDLAECTNGFISFQGIEINETAPSTNVTIDRNKIFFSVNYPIKISKQDASAEMDRFSAQVNAELMPMIDAAGEYMSMQKDAPGSFMFSLMGEIAARNNFTYTNVFFEDKKRVLITFVKNESVFGEPYQLWFGLSYE